MPQELSQNAVEGGKSLQQSNSSYECEILYTPQISEKIIEIMEKSEEFCYIITPYFKPWTHSKISIDHLSEERKKIIFFFRYNQEKEDIDRIKKFHDNYHFDIVLINNLHAKIYVNENEALITSMNLTNYAQENNHEIGVLIKNKEKFNDIKDIIKKIFKTGEKSALKNIHYDSLKNNLFFENRYCFLCNKPIKKDFKFFCDDCRDEYEKDKILGQKGQYCRKCGNKAKTTEKHPFCDDCQKNEAWDLEEECWDKNKKKLIN